MATVIKMTGKPRTDPKTGKPRPPVVSYKVRWYYPVPGGKAEEQAVTWPNFTDANTLKNIINARGGRVRKTDPDVLDRSIIKPGTETRNDTKPFGPTVADVIDEFIAQKVKDELKQSTIDTYKCGNRAGLLREVWGTEYVSQIDEDKARALLAHITGLGMDHRAPMQFANSVLIFAVRKGYLSANPLTLVARPKRLKFRPRFLAQDEFELMLSFVDEDKDDEFWLLLVMAWETGMRLGELLGLERDDITIVNDRATITVSRTTAESTSGRITLTPPKNGEARDVIIPVDLAERALEPGRHPQIIFPAFRNPRQRCRKKFVNARYNRVVELARKGRPVTLPSGEVKTIKLTGRPPRFHDLRHSHISNQLSEGVDLYVVSKRAGHSSIQITVDTYGHLCKKAELAQLAAITAHRVPSKRLKQNQKGLISVAA